MSRYDDDPEALAWARAKVQKQVDRMTDFERQAEESQTSDPAQWRRFRYLLETSFIGGEGCVVAAFDERYPALREAERAAGHDPDGPVY